MCELCHSSCRSCATGDQAFCLSCHSGYYLSGIPGGAPHGTCLPKTDSDGNTSVIYLSNSDTFTEDGRLNSQREGTETNPFVNLRDALVKADEVAAPFSGHHVTILISPGTHHIVTQTDHYSHVGSKDEADRDYHLTIQ